MKPQLDTVFGRMTSSLVLQLHLDDRPVSAELRGWMEELASYTEKLSVEVAPSPSEPAPCVKVLRADGSDTGLAFHGVPGGHEFTGLRLGLVQRRGAGQPLDDATRERIAAVEGPRRLDVLVSLSCTNCPDVVLSAQRIAAENAAVEAHVFDINHFPELKERYNVMSVPCLVVDGESRSRSGARISSRCLTSSVRRASRVHARYRVFRAVRGEVSLVSYGPISLYVLGWFPARHSAGRFRGQERSASAVMLTIGCHLSSAKGYRKMAEEAASINANTFQFFTRNRAAARRRPSTRRHRSVRRAIVSGGDQGCFWRTRPTR